MNSVRGPNLSQRRYCSSENSIQISQASQWKGPDRSLFPSGNELSRESHRKRINMTPKQSMVWLAEETTQALALTSFHSQSDTREKKRLQVKPQPPILYNFMRIEDRGTSIAKFVHSNRSQHKVGEGSHPSFCHRLSFSLGAERSLSCTWCAQQGCSA